MKKIKFLLMLLIGVVMSVSVVSCSKDDDDLGDPNKGSQNTTDVAVTGAVLAKTFNATLFTGYVNLNQLSSGYTSYEMGVEVSDNKSFSGKTFSQTSNALVGNKFEVVVNRLNPSTTYYYRTYVYVNKNYHYGETSSFVTDELKNVASDIVVKPGVLDVDVVGKMFLSLGDYENMFLEAEHLNNSNMDIGIYASKDKSLLNLKNIEERNSDDVTIMNCYFYPIWKETTKKLGGLEEGTTYYYCSYTMYGGEIKLGEIKSFKTLESKGCLTTDKVALAKYTISVFGSCKFYEMGIFGSYKVGVQLREKGTEKWNDVESVSMSIYKSDNSKDFEVHFDSSITKAKTTYECRVYLAQNYYNKNSIIFGNLVTFTTE